MFAVKFPSAVISFISVNNIFNVLVKQFVDYAVIFDTLLNVHCQHIVVSFVSINNTVKCTRESL